MIQLKQIFIFLVDVFWKINILIFPVTKWLLSLGIVWNLFIYIVIPTGTTGDLFHAIGYVFLFISLQVFFRQYKPKKI